LIRLLLLLFKAQDPTTKINFKIQEKKKYIWFVSLEYKQKEWIESFVLFLSEQSYLHAKRQKNVHV
jgi:hypothetical protein